MLQRNLYCTPRGTINRKRRARQRKLYFVLFVESVIIILMFFIMLFITSKAKGAIDKLEVSENFEESTVGASTYEYVETAPESPVLENSNIDDGGYVGEESTAVTNSYDYTMPVPESAAVENSYFDDAVFIGDSRTEGLILNMGLSNAINYTNKGLMVDTVFTKPAINKNGAKLSVMEALKETDFTKVYIMLGINETGWPYNDIFIERYGKVIDAIKEINPNAIIYVQGIMPVANSVSSSHRYIKNQKINEFNSLIIEMAEEKQIYYIDTVSPVAASDGSLPEDAATDGIHLKKAYCEKWLDCLKTHTITM